MNPAVAEGLRGLLRIVEIAGDGGGRAADDLPTFTGRGERPVQAFDPNLGEAQRRADGPGIEGPVGGRTDRQPTGLLHALDQPS